MHGVVLVLEEIGARLLAEAGYLGSAPAWLFLSLCPRITQWTGKIGDTKATQPTPSSRWRAGLALPPIAVVRVSGPGTRDGARGALRRRARAAARQPCATSDRRRRALLDRGLVLWFPAPASFTGEDMAELQLHGSRAVDPRTDRCGAVLPGTRLAEPGEFARRAFENGKLDLARSRAWPISSMPRRDASGEQALAAVGGLRRRALRGWRAELLARPGAGRGRARLRR